MNDLPNAQTFTVIGGGFSGVETAGEMKELIDRSLVFYPNVDRREVRVLIVEFADRLLGELPAKLGAYTRTFFEKRRIEVKLDTGVREATGTAIVTTGGEAIGTRTIVATIGSAPSVKAREPSWSGSGLGMRWLSILGHRSAASRRLGLTLMLSITQKRRHGDVEAERKQMTDFPDLFRLTGRRALVTGSSQGIGMALARGLRSAGAQIVLNGRDETKLEAAAQTLRKEAGSEPASVDLLPFDVTDHAVVRQAIDAFEAEHGAIDILINNAGMQHRTPLEDFPAEAFQRMLQTNIASVFNVGQACARHMIRRGKGKIINIASVQTALARPGIAPYTSTKGAVANLTKGMATDWARHGLQCNAIAPGYFETPLNAALVADPDFCRWLEGRTPAGRWGKVEELVGAAIFLASDASSFVNGHTLFVDGGISVSL